MSPKQMFMQIMQAKQNNQKEKKKWKNEYSGKSLKGRNALASSGALKDLTSHRKQLMWIMTELFSWF